MLDQWCFVFDLEFKLCLLIMIVFVKGVELLECKFMVYCFGVKGNNFYGLGLGMWFFWFVFFKCNGVVFWMKFFECFVIFILVGKYFIGSLFVQ